ncbi:BolA family transcriptional regulator [Alteromonadaceae bacterium M269]|jgi:acid stress-induced BolA-like protein IbaG/YrbA|nr:BolA family transcriptional regulator [Alteromonadaceae bacterium M269]
MQIDDIKALLNDALELSELQVMGEGSHFQVIAVGDIFEGMSRVKKQQAVYAPLSHLIADGSMHAVTIKAFSNAEWEKQKLFHSTDNTL